MDLPVPFVTRIWDWWRVIRFRNQLPLERIPSLKQIDFEFEAEHSLWVGTPQLRWWPCGSFHVVAAP